MQREGSIGWEEAVVKVLQLVSGRKGHLQEWTLLSVSNAATIPTWRSGSLVSTSPPATLPTIHPFWCWSPPYPQLSFIQDSWCLLTKRTPHCGSVMPKRIVVADGVYWCPLMTVIIRTTTPCMWTVQSIFILKVSMLGCNVFSSRFLNHWS